MDEYGFLIQIIFGASYVQVRCKLRSSFVRFARNFTVFTIERVRVTLKFGASSEQVNKTS